MSDIQLTDIPQEKVPHEDISMQEIRRKAKVSKREYEVEQKEISPNIQKFERKVKVYTQNPYSYNAVSVKKFNKKPVAPSPSASSLISNPLYNQAGKVLGVDTVHDWNAAYDKVYEIVEWAKKKTKSDNQRLLMKFIYEKMNRAPSLGKSRLDDLYIFAGVSR